MAAANHFLSGRRRLLFLFVAVIATAAAASLGIGRAFAVINQGTTTTLAITDANTGQPITGSIGSSELVTITVTVQGQTAAPVGTFALSTTTDGLNFANLCDNSGTCSWAVASTGATTSVGSMTMMLPAGTYDIKAAYKESTGAGFSNSASGLTPVTVATISVHNTATGLIATPGTITSGNATTLVATVTSLDNSGTPSGTVVFYSLQGGQKTLIGQSTLDATGTATLSRSDWSVGSLPLEADYLGTKFVNGSGNTVQYNPSSGTAALTVNPASNPAVQTTTTVTAIPIVLRSDQVVHVAAHVAQIGTSTASLVAGILFRAQQVGATGAEIIGSTSVDANGNASIDVGGWSPGNYIITADYFGNVNFQPSSGQTTILTVNPTLPSVTTYLHDTQTYVGDTATLSAQVVDGNTGLPVPAGDLVVLTANDSFGTTCSGYTDPNGIVACTVVFPAPGTFTVTANFGGDATYDPSSGTGQITVLQVPTNVTVTPSPNPVPTGSSDTLTTHLTDARPGGGPIAGRMVTLTLNNNETCNAGPTDANGNASCNVTVSEGPGTYGVTASFAGDGPNGRYLPSNGNNTLGVVAVLPTNWTYTGTTTVYAGQPATLQFVLRDNLGRLMGNRHVTLSLNGTNYNVTTDANGVATQPITAPATAGTYYPSASYGGEPGYLASTGTGALQVTTIPTSLTYTGTQSAYGGTPVTISFQLKDVNGNVLPGMLVTESLPGGGSYTATTDSTGSISDTITAPTPAVNTTYTPTASFGGSLPYLASQGTGSLLVSVVPTNITYNGDTSVNAGAQAKISFVLRDSTTGNVLPNQQVTITLPDNTTYTTTTDSNGVASDTVTAPLSAGSYPVKETFAGKNQYLPSVGTGTLVVTTIPTSVTYVGDTTVIQGSTATLAAKLVDVGGNVLPNETLTLTMSTGETCSGVTNSLGIASCQVVVNEATTLPGSPYPISIKFNGDLPYLPSTGTGAIAVTAPYAAPAAGWCTTGGHKCESIIANPTVVSPTQLQVLYTDDSALPTTASLAPTAVLDGGQQLVVTVTPTSGVGAPPGAVSYVDTYGGSTSTKNQDFINIAVPAGLSPGNHTIRVFISDGDGDWDQWTWTINVGSNGAIGTVNPGPGTITCSGSVKCESILADPAVVSNSQLSIVAMDDAAIPMAGVTAPSATLNGQALPLSVSATSGQPANYVDKTGGSLASTYQALIKINLPSLAPGTYTILITAYDGDGDVDQFGWSITVGSTGAVTSNFTGGGGATGKSTTSSVAGTLSNAVTAGNTVWLSDTTKVSGLPATGATVTFTNQTVTIGSTTYAVPNSEVYYSPYATAATTTWDPVNNEWDTVVPKSLGGNVFASGLGFVAPAAIAKGTKVTWNATISSDTAGVTVAWQWAAATYSSFNTDPSQLGMKACDDGKAQTAYQNGDKAGTPENYKSYLTAGGTGGGGTNYTGAFTGATNVKF